MSISDICIRRPIFTWVLVAIPVALGMVGRFFSSFGLTIAFAIVMSLFVSFTLTPMLCAHFLKLEPEEAGHAKSKDGAIYRVIDWFYGKALAWSLRHRLVMAIICLYDVWLRADKSFRANPQDLEKLTIPSPTAGQVQLSSLAKLTESRGPSQIDRMGRQRTVTLMAHPDEISLNDAMKQAQAIVKEMNMPPGYEITFGGQAKMLGETGYYFAVALGLSILFMYLILAAQFESWLNPVAILAALPITIPFGLLSLLLFNTPMDLYAMFGLFMLIGIVKPCTTRERGNSQGYILDA